MSNLKKVNKSNKAHLRLANKHNDKANLNKDSSSKKFYSLVKRDYHESVARDQKRFNKILTKNEKKNLWRLAERSLAEYRLEVNKNYGFNRYVPKKYR